MQPCYAVLSDGLTCFRRKQGPAAVIRPLSPDKNILRASRISKGLSPGSQGSPAPFSAALQAGEQAEPYLRRCISGALQHHLRKQVKAGAHSTPAACPSRCHLGHISPDVPGVNYIGGRLPNCRRATGWGKLSDGISPPAKRSHNAIVIWVTPQG